MVDDTDLVTRLRDEADLCRAETADDVAKLLDAAASELERLRAEVGKWKSRYEVEARINGYLQSIDAAIEREQGEKT